MSSNFKKFLNVYEFDTKLPGTGQELKIRPITTGQMKRLLMYETVEDVGKVEEALDQLIQECVINEDFNIRNVYIQDRFWLLLELRKITKGNIYTFTALCQNEKCNSQYVQNVDLTKLKVKPFPLPVKVEAKKPTTGKVSIKVEKKKKDQVETEIKEVPVENPWLVQINDNITVEMNMVTRGMQADAMAIVSSHPEWDELKKKIETLMITTAQCITAIITPDGREDKLTLEEKLFFLENITQPEMDKIQNWLDNKDYGIDFTFTTVCPHCNNSVDRDIPLEDFFF